MRLLHLLAGVLLLGGGCGDNTHPPAAADFDGLWLITARTAPAEDGALRTETRYGSSHALRGDAAFTVTGHATGTWHVRMLVLDDGLATAAPAPVSYAVAVEPDRWVMLDPEGAVTVYETELDGDRLTLTWDPRDPRGTAASPPTRWLLHRAPPWPAELAGSWTLISLEYPTRTILADVCLALQGDPTDTRKLTMDWSFDARLVLESFQDVYLYVDSLWPQPPHLPPLPPCRYRAHEDWSRRRGIAELEGSTLRLWSFQYPWSDVAVRAAEAHVFDVQLEGDLATLTQVSCLPLPDCKVDRFSWLDSTLSRLVLRRRADQP